MTWACSHLEPAYEPSMRHRSMAPKAPLWNSIARAPARTASMGAILVFNLSTLLHSNSQSHRGPENEWR